MSDADALLSAIIAHPDEDTPRLAYADWLDEHGQPERAEFIRFQIERAALDPQSERHRVCADREAELLTRHRRAWEREFREAVPGGVFGYRRGFVAQPAVIASSTSCSMKPQNGCPAGTSAKTSLPATHGRTAVCASTDPATPKMSDPASPTSARVSPHA